MWLTEFNGFQLCACVSVWCRHLSIVSVFVSLSAHPILTDVYARILCRINISSASQPHTVLTMQGEFKQNLCIILLCFLANPVHHSNESTKESNDFFFVIIHFALSIRSHTADASLFLATIYSKHLSAIISVHKCLWELDGLVLLLCCLLCLPMLALKTITMVLSLRWLYISPTHICKLMMQRFLWEILWKISLRLELLLYAIVDNVQWTINIFEFCVENFILVNEWHFIEHYVDCGEWPK